MDLLDDAVSVASLIQPVLDQLEEAGERGSARPAALTGFRDLDDLTGGLRPGQVWVITGRSGVGKSVLALDIARHLAVRQSRHVEHVLTRESPSQVMRRLLAAEARVCLRNMQLGTLSDDDWARFSRRMTDLAQCHLSFRVAQERLASVATASAPETDVLVIDSLPASWLAHPPALDALRQHAVRRGVAVLVVLDEPLRRDRQDATERLGRDADVVIRLFREDMDHPDSPRVGEADLVVERHRSGPVSTITVSFQGHYSRFVDMAAP